MRVQEVSDKLDEVKKKLQKAELDQDADEQVRLMKEYLDLMRQMKNCEDVDVDD